MKSFKSFMEATYKVEIEGLPTMYVDSDSEGKVKQELRKLVKKPDMIKDVERVTPAQVKKHFRLKAAGKDEEIEEGKHGPEGTGHTQSDYADKFAKKKIKLSKHVDQDMARAGLEEDAPANAVAHGGVDMNPTGKIKKQDGRSRFDTLRMYRRSAGGK